MSDVFLSYASADRERAVAIAELLRMSGYSVWWDRTIPPGRVFDEVLQEALSSAGCIVVLWSRASVASNWVKTEAAEGATRQYSYRPFSRMCQSRLSSAAFKRRTFKTGSAARTIPNSSA